MHPDVERILITEDQIAKRVKELGAQITKDYQGKNLTMVSVLKGSVVFFTDLMRAIDLPMEIDFMVVSSYGSGVVSSGVVRIVKDIDLFLEGKDILIIEDILDSGKTLHYIEGILQGRRANSIRICTFMDKPARREVDIQADYTGFEIPDDFVVGYGLDYDQRYRNLPYVGVLKPSVYTK